MRETTPFPKKTIDALANLKFIVTTGRRNASIDIQAASERGIPVCGTQSNMPPPAHHAASLILAATRGLTQAATAMRTGGWNVELRRDVFGLTLGLVGYGRLGAHTAKLMRPFGMNIIAYSRNIDKDAAAAEGVTAMPSFEALLKDSDIVSIHLILSAATQGMFNKDTLALMKPDALLVNTSRGAIIDKHALLDALHNDKLGGAALDVFDQEPLPLDDPLRDAGLMDSGKLLLTPHIGYKVKQTYELFYRQTVEDIAAWKNGTPLRVIEP
jgi:phosphoglycerate dehydrogenase-like enzyme